MKWFSLWGEAELLNIRRATRADIGDLEALEEQFELSDRVSRRSWTRFIDGPASVWVAQADGGVQAGVIILYRRGTSLARLYSLSVAKTHWGQGLARNLLTVATDDAVARGCRALALEVRASNTRAISLYERFGFVIQGEKIGYYSNGENALRMIFQLQAKRHHLHE